MIKVLNLWKHFGDQAVLKDISLLFEKGKTNLIIGKSGSGKTVLMKCITGLAEADSGSIYFDDREFSAMSARARRPLLREVGMLFQGAALFDSLTISENVRFPLEMFTKMTGGEKEKRAEFCLERVNLHNVGHLKPSGLSGGMKKRAAIARAIAIRPRYLFCDEPNSGLDPPTAILIDKLIRDITEEYMITTVVNTHDMNSVMEIGDTIAFIHNGELWWTGGRHEVLRTSNDQLNSFVYATELMRTINKGQKQ